MRQFLISKGFAPETLDLLTRKNLRKLAQELAGNEKRLREQALRK